MVRQTKRAADAQADEMRSFKAKLARVVAEIQAKEAAEEAKQMAEITAILRRDREEVVNGHG